MASVVRLSDWAVGEIRSRDHSLAQARKATNVVMASSTCWSDGRPAGSGWTTATAGQRRAGRLTGGSEAKVCGRRALDDKRRMTRSTLLQLLMVVGSSGKNRDFHISRDISDEVQSEGLLFDANLGECEDGILEGKLKISMEKVSFEITGETN